MFIAMNHFKVAEGKAEEFENTWRNRETYLEGVPGFVEFALLKADAEGEYISHSVWKDRAAFVDWTNSEAFVKGHRQGSLMGVLEGAPHVSTYQAIIVQGPDGRTVDAE